MLRIDVLTLFPKMFDNILGESILKRAIHKGILKVNIYNLRDWTFDSHRSADDKPFGGGPGMVMKVEPVYLALKELTALDTTHNARRTTKSRPHVILLTPQGKRLDQKIVKGLAKYKRLMLICGHYEGVDERIRDFVDEEISIGDYILTCGELPALVLIDAVTRLLPGTLGDERSTQSESFENNLLEYPQYTRPAVFFAKGESASGAKTMSVPQVLLSGDHEKIGQWRREQALKRTSSRRPDLIKRRR